MAPDHPRRMAQTKTNPMKSLLPILILTTAAGFSQEPSRFDVTLQRAAINARVEAIPGSPAYFNRPAPQLPAEDPAEIKRRLRLEILGPFADIAPHPATEFGMRLSRIRRAEEQLGFPAVRFDFEAVLRDLRAWLDANTPR